MKEKKTSKKNRCDDGSGGVNISFKVFKNMMIIEVEEGTFAEATEGDTINSGGAGPCILVGLYDTKQKRGYMAHIAFAIIEESLMNDFLNHINNSSKADDLKAFIAGGAFLTGDDEETKNNILENREIILQRLKGFVPMNKITVKWSDQDQGVELILKTTTGEFILE